MKFNQKEDGSCEIIFTEEEIQILNKHKKLSLTPEFLRHFSNHLIKIVVNFNKKFNDETKNLNTYVDTEVETTEPK
jgi:hypothetical protein